MAKDNGFFGNGDGKALAAAVAKRNEIGYAKSRGVAVPNPTIPKPKKSTSLNTTYDLSTYDDDTLLRDSASLGSLLVDSMSGGDRYRSSGDRSDLSRRHSLYNSYLVELKKRGYDTKTADAGSAEMGNFISELNAFSSQFEDEADYDDRYGYYQKYDKSSSSDIEKKIAELSKKGGNEAELNWLKSHRYEYYTTEEMKRLEKELEQRVKQSKENDEALARQTGMFLGADSDDTTSLRTQLAAVQNAIRDNAYAEQAEKWDNAHRKIFYDQYGGWLNKISRENQGTRVNAGEMVSGELEAARKGTAEMEEYLKKKGYSDEELRGLRAYAQSQANLRRYYGNMEYWEGVSDKGFWGKVGATVASIPANLMSGMAFVDSALQGLTNDEDAFTGEKQQVDYNASPLAYAGENMRAAVSKDMSKAGQFFYNTGMSIADFLVARGAMKATGAVGKDIKALGKIGKGVGNSAEMMLAGSAANSSMRAAKARGATDAEAIGFGFLSGVAEMAGEHASIEHLNTIERAMGNAASKRTVANIFKSIGMQAAVEGSEEGMTTLANTLSDFVIMGDRSEYNLSVANYVAEGESQEDAKRHALTDWLTSLALDVAAGAISGGVTSGVSIGAGAAHSKVQESVVGWKEKESLHYLLTIDRALNYPESSETRKLAENLAARLDNATTLSEAKITDGEIGKLVKLMSEEESQLEKSDETNTRSAVNPVSAFRAANNAQTATEQPGAVQENAPEPVVVSPTAAAFEAEGISTEDAMERAKILDALLAGEQVSNSQLEKLGSIKDKAGQAAFTAVTGEQIPASVTASGLRKFYRETAAKYAETQKMTADAKESAQQAEADQAVADAAARMETDPAAAFRPPLDTAEQTQYNKKGRSPEVTSIINRLNEGEVPLEEVVNVPKIKAALQENDSATPTNELPNRETIQDAAYEQAMAQGSFNGTDYSGPVRQERRIDIVLGLPGFGKSSVYTERISQENGSRVVDTDDYREYIPEYNGQNAGVVHEEASAIKKRVLTQALKNGDNIILSTIGANAQKLERDIIGYNGMGYSVHLHLNELPNHKAMARAIGRFLPEDGSQGRFVSPEIIAEYGDKPTQTYLYLTGRREINGIHAESTDSRGEGGTDGAVTPSGAERAPSLREGRRSDQRGRAGSTGVVSRTPAGAEITSYDWYNNDVKFGQPPILVESSGAKAKGGAINAGTESGVSTEGRTGTAAEGADSNGDTGARLDDIRSGNDRGAQEQGPVGRGDTGVHGVIRLSETEKRIITDSGNTVVELEDFTSEPAVFSSALTAAREADVRNGWAVSPQNAESLAERNVTLLMSEDGSAGLGITPSGDIIGVFKNPQSGGRGALYTLLPTALANGGTKLDCYGDDLVGLYARFGFVPVARVKFDAEQANPGWTPEKGEPEIYFMRHNGASAEQSLTDAIARKKRGDTNPIFPQEYLDALPEMSYEEAEAYRDALLEMSDEEVEAYRDALIEKKVKLDDGTELTREEFGERVRKIVPDATELEIDTAFYEGLESSDAIETEEISMEGHTERVITKNAAEELIGDVRGAEHVTVDEGIKLSRGQMWLAKFLANSLRKTGVVERVEITDKFGANIEGAIQNDVLYLSSKNVTPSYIAQKTIGHELFHAAVDKITKNAVRDTAMVNDVLESFAEIAEDFDLDKRIKERTDAYKSAYAAQTNPATGKPYTATEINLLINEEYIREEIAADVMGDVFARQKMLNDMAGLRPGIIARAYLAVNRLSHLRANHNSEARAVRNYAKRMQSSLLAALEMSGSYEVENGESIVRTSVSDKSWEKQMELGFVALGLRNVDGYTAADYASAREELGDSCFMMKEVPAILQEVGLGDKPLTYTQQHFANATLPLVRDKSGREIEPDWHGLSEDTLIKLPELLARPAMILRSRQQSKIAGKSSDAIIVIIDAYDPDGAPVGAVISPNGSAVVDGVNKSSNHILSIHGFRHLNSANPGANMLRDAVDNDRLLYVNGELTDKMLRKIGQKKSAEPINSARRNSTGEEYSANEAVSAAAGPIPLTRQTVSSRRRSGQTATQDTSSPEMVSQKTGVVNSRYKALAANPYLRGVEFDTVLGDISGTTARVTTEGARRLTASRARSGYTRSGELLRWKQNKTVGKGALWSLSERQVGEENYLDITNPLILDCEGRDMSRLSEVADGRGSSVSELSEYVYNNELEYDGIILRNLNTDGIITDAAVTLFDVQAIRREEPQSVTITGQRFSVAESKYAPTFYSKLERVIETQKQDKFGASSVVNMLRGKGVKAEEIKWSGINTFLDGKKSVTKDELLGFLRDNQLQIGTVELSDTPREKPVVEFYDTESGLVQPTVWGSNRIDVVDTQTGEVYATVEPHWDEGYMYDLNTGDEYWGEADLLESLGITTANARLDDTPQTRWGEYTLDGGENYRELLYMMPGSEYYNSAMNVHWGRDGVLAHARVQDFTGAEGDKVLFIEEIQSDWHNAGQKQGYEGDPKIEAEYKRLQDRVIAVEKELDHGEMAEIVRKLAILRFDGNHEYAKNYLASTARSAGRTAAEYEYLRTVVTADSENRALVYESGDPEFGYSALTQEGIAQASADAKIVAEWQERWVAASYEFRSFKWSTEDLAPDAPFRNSYTDFVLKNLIRDAAENGYTQIAWTTGAQQEARWSSEYAEGYRIEYDQDIPSFLKKYGKQWGAKIGYTVIGCDLTDTGAYQEGGMEAVMTIALNDVDETGRLSNGAYVVHSMDITDAMKQSVLYDGQPRFSVKASDFGFTGEIRSARGVRLSGEAKRAISSKIMSGDAQIDGIRGTARTFDYEYTFEVYSDGSVEITDVISNEDINRLIESDRRRQKNAERLGSGRSNARRLYTTRPDAGGEADVSERHNDRGRGKRSSETYGREPGRDIPRSGDGEQENTRQTDVDPETEALFSAENALRFAVSGANMDTLIQNMLRRRVSKVRSNTFERSGIFTRTELDQEGLRASDMQYDVISERASMAEAQRRLEADYEGTKKALFKSEAEWKGADLDTAMGILSQELENARQTNNYSEVIGWAQRIRERGTDAGQMIQAFAKYTRTPEGVLIRAAADLKNSRLSNKERAKLLDRIAKFEETLEAIQTGDKEALIQLILKQAKQRNTPVSEKTLAAMRADTTDFQFLYDTAITQLDQIAKDYAKTGFGRKVSTFQTLAHLLNLKTAGRNLISNNVFTMVDSLASNAAMMPDLILSAITGQRTVGLDRSRLSKAARAGAQDARNRARIEVALDVAPNDRHDKYGTSRRTWKMSGGKGSQVMSTLEKAMGFELNYTDESAKGAIRAQVIQSLQPFVDNGTITTEEAQQFAEEEARYRTFQDDAALATILGLFKKTLNVVGFGGATPLIKGKALKTHDFGLGDIVVKYTQVPGALITRAFEFSPLGYAKALVNTYKMFEARHELSKRTDISDAKKAELKTEQDLRQRRAALFIGRATTGTGLIAFFAALASAGLLHRGDDEDDPDAKALNTSMGINGTQLNMSALGRWISGESIDWREGDVLASLDFLEPFNSEMAMGTLIARSEEGINAANLAVKSIKALGGAFADLSVMQTLRTIIDTYTYYTPDSGVGIEDEDADKWVTVGLNVALSGATGFVPAPVRQLAQATDISNRDAYSERDVWAKTWAQLRSAVPGLRETLPVKQTNFGEPKPAENALLRAVNAFTMPGSLNTYKPSSAADELADVYRETGEANIYPDRNAPYKITTGSGHDKEEYKLTQSEREKYLRTRGQLSKQLIDSARASDAYRNADEYTKADMLVKAKNYANYVAKKEALAEKGIQYSDATYENYDEMLASGVDLSSYLAYSSANNELEADVDENGDPVSGTKKAKTIDLIGSLNMDSEQKSALYFKAYPNEKDDFDDLGIEFDEYYTYSRAMCTLTGDKDANGKTISGSKKVKVVSLIDSLDIPSEAKTKLYLQNGYSAKNIPSWS